MAEKRKAENLDPDTNDVQKRKCELESKLTPSTENQKNDVVPGTDIRKMIEFMSLVGDLKVSVVSLFHFFINSFRYSSNHVPKQFDKDGVWSSTSFIVSKMRNIL